MKKPTAHELLHITVAVLLTISIALTLYVKWGPQRPIEFSHPVVYYNGVEQSCVKNEAQSDNSKITWDCSPKRAA